MGWFRRARAVRDVAMAEPARATFAESEPRPIADVIASMSAASGRVTRDMALGVPAVLRGRNLICGSIASLPLRQFGPDRRVERSPLLEQIDDNVANVVVIAQTVEDLLFEGVAWWQITARGWNEFPTSARHLDVGAVTLNPPPGSPPHHLPSGLPLDGFVWVDGRPVAKRDVIRFDSPNPPLLQSPGRAIRRAVAIEAAAELYANNPRALDYFRPVEGADPVDDEGVRLILDGWAAARRRAATGYVPAALEHHVVDQLSPADLQLVQLQQRAGLDLANALGLDPEDLGISTTSRTYQNATDRRQDRVNDVLNPYMRAVTDRLSMGDITRRGYVVHFDLDDYMRADPRTRWETRAVAVGLGALTVEEIREDEMRPSLPRPAAPRPATPRPAAEPVRASSPAGASFGAEVVGFDSDVAAGFAVDRERRIISGLAVPYGPVARSGGRRWRFTRGALQWRDVGRVKLLRDHDNSQPVGVAVSLDDTDRGLLARFRVARGPAGDEVLALAEDGVLDGLSVGVDFDADGIQSDPDNDGVMLVRRGRLREITITAMPAFDDARVAAVAAEHEGTDLQMAETTEATPVAIDTPGGAAFASAADRLAEAADRLAAAAERPAVVDPAAAALAVNESLPYRFDGGRSEYDFSSDLIASQRDRSGEAAQRLARFMSAAFAVTQSNAGALNPNRQRPDLYVDQLEYPTPIWDAISKGSIGDNTPFVLPKFASAGTLIADHVEGTEPSLGSFTATTQTITPAPVSGKIEINREAWDQGGNPQLSGLIWRQMLRAHSEALEAKAVALLDGLTPTGITITAGATNATLEAALTSALASLQYIRGGNRFRDFFVQIDLYKALVGAVDGQGRKLFPILAPSNATGTTDSFFADVAIGGLRARPAWALAATGSVAASSYLFNREDVHGWASAPQRFDFDYQVKSVFVGLWGYVATACTRVEGVREVIYDPVA